MVYLYKLYCLRHNKADVKNVIYSKFEHFKVILNVNLSYLLYVIAENSIIRNEFNSYLSCTRIKLVRTVNTFLCKPLCGLEFPNLP